MIPTNDIIELAVYQLFTGPGQRFDSVDLGKFPASLRPGLNVAVVSGNPIQESRAGFREDVVIVVLIAAKNINSEKERRRLIHPLMAYATNKLALATLVFQPETGDPEELDLEDILPGPWVEKTTPDQFKAGEIVFERQFKTAYRWDVVAPDAEAEQKLTEVLAEFGMQQETLTSDLENS